MSQVPTGSEVYYRDQYWNDHELTIRQFNRLVADVPSDRTMSYWIKHLKDRYFAKIPAKKALFINCGNGWAERELFDLGIFDEGVGFDYSDTLLADARTKAGSRPLTYFQADCNAVELPENSFDLIVNVAAMHHVQYIDRMNRLLAKALTPSGIFANFDYVGPHRNQYDQDHFATITTVNSALPVPLQNHRLAPAHLETMLATDPTEAIHSELGLSMFERYFIPVERKDLNGAIAYQIMYNNRELLELRHASVDAYVTSLLKLDELFTVIGKLPTLCSFYVGRPRKSALLNSEALERFTAEEHEREEHARMNGGRYYV